MNFLPRISATLKNQITIIAFTLAVLNAFGQTFQTSVGYNSPTNEKGVSGLVTDNGDFLVLGNNVNHPAGLFNPSGDMELQRLDNYGNLILPSRMIGQDLTEKGTWIEKSADCNGNPGYIISGNENAGGLNDMLLFMTNSAGNPIWVRRIGEPNMDETSACVKMDGKRNVILVGTKTDPITGISSIHAVKTDCSGSLIWEQVYRVNGSATAASVTAFATFQSECGGLPEDYYITGTINPGPGKDEELFILSVNSSNGAVVWMNTYDAVPNAAEFATCIQGRCSGTNPPAGSLWVSAYSYDSSDPKPKKILMMQTDLNGNTTWAKTYDLTNSDREMVTHFQFANNKKLVLTGKAEQTGIIDPAEDGQCFIMRFNDNSIGTDWIRVFTNAYASQGNRVEPTINDEYFISGFDYDLTSANQPDYNILAIKTNQNGETSSECYHDLDTKIISRQPKISPQQPEPYAPQDFKMTDLSNTLFDVPQRFCPPDDADPCEKMGLVANFSISGSGNTLSFTDLSTVGSGSIFSWNWDFGDANTSTLQNPVHTYSSTGVYTVCLIVGAGDAAGIVCYDTICKDIDVPFEQADTCEGNIVLNGDFTQGLVPGNLGSTGAVTNWSNWTGSPQVITGDYCQDPGAIQMWGNQVVGESIRQSVSFVPGGIYEVSFCGKWLNTVQGNVQIRFRASQGLPSSYLSCGATCDEIYLSPVLDTTWTTYNSAPWTATQNYNTLTISIWNNYAINDGAFVSWARIDDICIHRIGTTATHDITGELEAKLYPNPTNGDVNVVFGKALEQETVLTVMDLRGKTVFQTIVAEGSYSEHLSLNHCPSGMYIVRALSSGRQVWMEKVIKE